jgi:hypothetical protein
MTSHELLDQAEVILQRTTDQVRNADLQLADALSLVNTHINLALAKQQIPDSGFQSA